MDQQQLDYLLNLLDYRRDEVTDAIVRLESSFTDQFYLHQDKRYKKRLAERDLNATITVKLLNAKRELRKEETVIATSTN